MGASQKSKEKRPKVGIGVFIIKNRKVLLGKRRKAHGDGTWAPPGGHLEFNESPEECAKREALEETGLRIKNVRRAAFTNDCFRKEKKHYTTLFMVANYASGKLRNREPEFCGEWKWFSWDKLPKPLFLPVRNLLKQKFSPFR